jgi:NAD(P)H dehydrogenase (quinone)
MKIGTSGASGHLGRAVVSEPLQRPGGHEVVAVTRTPETVSGPAQGRFGDYNRPESLAGLCGPRSSAHHHDRRSGTPKARDAERRGREGGRQAYRLMSAVGTRQEEEPGRGASYWRGEQHLIATAPAWTILRMNFYAEAFLQQAQAEALRAGVVSDANPSTL